MVRRGKGVARWEVGRLDGETGGIGGPIAALHSTKGRIVAPSSERVCPYAFL